MAFPVNLELLQDVSHMPALPALARSMRRPDLRLHDFCIPVNAYFPTSELLADLQTRLPDILRYYPSDQRSVAEQLALFVNIGAEHLVVANGSTELITWINERMISGGLVTDVPTFGRWTDNPGELGHAVHTYMRQPSNDFRLNVDDFVRFARESGARALAICNPNNPTGALIEPAELLRLLDDLRWMDLVVVDESFIDFAVESHVPTIAAEAVRFDNVIVIKSLGKNLGLHGLRCGYAVANEKLAARLRGMLPPWNVNSLAEEFVRLLAPHRQDYEAARRRTVRDVKKFAERLAQLDGLTVFPANANFVYGELDSSIPGVELRNTLLEQHGCFVRECGSKIGSSSQFLRIASRPAAEQRVLLQALPKAIAAVRGLVHSPA